MDPVRVVRFHSLVELVVQHPHVIDAIVNYSVCLRLVGTERSSDLLNDPSFVLARKRENDTVKTRHVESFVCKLGSKQALNFSVAEAVENSLAILARSFACKD